MKQRVVSWGVFAIFVACAVGLEWHDDMLRFDGQVGAGKAVVCLVFLGFLGYSVYCSSRENIFKSLAAMAELHWGRQVGIDLYLGLGLTLFFMYLHDGSWVVVALWLLPILLFANLATLFYVAIHFESIVAKFIT